TKPIPEQAVPNLRKSLRPLSPWGRSKPRWTVLQVQKERFHCFTKSNGGPCKPESRTRLSAEISAKFHHCRPKYLKSTRFTNFYSALIECSCGEVHTDLTILKAA